MSFPALKEAQERLTAKQKELADIFTEAGPDLDMTKVKSLGDSANVVDHIRNLNSELDDLGKKVDDLQVVAKAAERSKDQGSGAERDDEPATKTRKFESLGDSFVKSASFKSKHVESTIDVDLKTLMSTTAGWAPESTRTGRLVLDAQRPIQVLDIIPQGTTSQAAVVYMEETTFTNNAAEAAEAGTYGEAALVLTEVSETVRKIAVWLPITDEQLEDEAQARGYVNNRLPFMLMQRLDSQVLVGDGTAPNLSGITDRSGIQTQAKGTDPTPDAVYKAMTKVRVTGRAIPNAAVFHPNDWQDVRLLRTADGIYIWGSPSEAGPERIWGITVVQSDALTENTALVGDFANYCELTMRRGIDVQVTNAHSDFFINGKQAMRADMRAAFCVYRPAAFATVTGV